MSSLAKLFAAGLETDLPAELGEDDPVAPVVQGDPDSRENLAISLEAPIWHDISALATGTLVLLSGTIYTARDAAHKRMIEQLQQGIPLPFDPAGQVIYYTGPTPQRAGEVIGSAGPTSSYRMDPYTPTLLELGLKACIGKGERNCMAAFAKFGAKYFLAIGGTGALISKCIVESKIIAYQDLGTEAIRKLQVKNMRLIVG